MLLACELYRQVFGFPILRPCAHKVRRNQMPDTRSSISRRNLIAAGTAVLAALATTRAAQAKNGHGHGHGRGIHCYLGGTVIRVPDGEREVSELKIGDLVSTS